MPHQTSLDRNSPVLAPAPKPHDKDLPTLRLILTSARNTLDIWPDYSFEVPFSRRTVLGVEAVLLNDPDAVHYVMAKNATNFVRPKLMARILRPLLGHGVFLAEGDEWRRQRRLLSPAFTPNNVGLLLPHFAAAATDLVQDLEGAADADLSAAFQSATLDAALRALFSMPDKRTRDHIGSLVRSFANGPGRFSILDNLAADETSFAFAQRKRRAFQKVWSGAIDDVVAERQRIPNRDGYRDLLDILLAARDSETGARPTTSEVRDQAATMIFGGFETTARLLFWATYLLTLDLAEQERVRAEVLAHPLSPHTTLTDLTHWPRLRMVLLEAMQLYPPVPHLVREPLADDVIAGEPVRRGVQVWISPWVLHRHRAHWQNPTAFIPDRFAGTPSPWSSNSAYLPFGSGPRICLGATFAMAEAQIMMAALLTRFKVSPDNDPPVMPIGRLTIEPSRAPMFKLQSLKPNLTPS